jgi:hypothetical protein
MRPPPIAAAVVEEEDAGRWALLAGHSIISVSTNNCAIYIALFGSARLSALGIFFTFSLLLRNPYQVKISPTHRIRRHSFLSKAMVLIHLKSALPSSDDGNGEFLFETKSSTKVDDLIESVVSLNNARLRSSLIVDTVRGLATYGPMKQPDSTTVEEMSGKHTPDPSGLRTGFPPDEKMAAILHQAATALEDYVGRTQVEKKVALTLRDIDIKIKNVRDAVDLAYPTGLSETELTRMALKDPFNNEKLNLPLVDATNAALWAFNKEFVRGQLVSDRLGTNEKTKVICKLTLKDAGPPPREAIVSEAERNAMASYYHKRQEELKRLADADDDDDYLNSDWANPKGMKNSLQGLSDVKAPGLRF